MLKVLMLTAILTVVSYGNEDCKSLFIRTDFDYSIKSPKGWTRVCNNDKMHRYFKGSYLDLKDICECVTVIYAVDKTSSKGVLYAK